MADPTPIRNPTSTTPGTDGPTQVPALTPDLTPEAWLEDFAARLGVPPPTAEEVEALLALAGVAAHASARTAAPIACFLVGRAGVSLADASAAASAVGPGR